MLFRSDRIVLNDLPLVFRAAHVTLAEFLKPEPTPFTGQDGLFQFFGMIVALNIQAKGIKKEKAVVRETISAGWIAGILLLAVYGMLTYVGKISGITFAGAANGTEVLVDMAGALFGKLGTVILAVIFVIACFNTCVGLFSCCGEYFAGIFPKIG